MVEIVQSSLHWQAFGRRECLAITLMFASFCVWGIGTSFQAPLYPPEATKRGMTASVYGTFLGFSNLLTFLFNPVVSVWILKGWFGFGVRSYLLLSFLTNGVVLVMYGLLDLLQSKTAFALASFVVRTLDGISSTSSCSFYIALCLILPNHIAFTTGLAGPLLGFLFAVGPILGEAIGGYMVPFIGLGLLQITLSLILSCVLPSIQKLPDIDTSVTDNLFKLLKLLQVPRFLLSWSATVVTFFVFSFISAILTEDLEQFNLKPVSTGIMFLLLGLPQVLGPGCGYLVDKFGWADLFSLSGFMIGVLGLIVLGPVPFLPLNPSLWTSGVGLILVGFSMAALLGSNFANLIQDANSHGTTDDSLFSVIGASSYYVAAVTLGYFLGPTIAGVVFDAYGFRSATLLPLVAYLLMGILFLGFGLVKWTSPDVAKENMSEEDTEETQPLISSSNST